MKTTLLIYLTIFALLAGGEFQDSVSGYVKDKSTGESLIGANVMLNGDGLLFGTATDVNGYFVIGNLTGLNYELIITYIGYKSVQQNIQVELLDSILNIELDPAPLQFEEIQVSGEKISRQNNIQFNSIKLTPLQLRSLPAMAEPDIFRTIQALPGVLTQSEFSTGLVIRGGNTDQNLILLDGITVYNPSHMGGVFSNFIVDAIREAKLIKGGFNAEYGGRISSVLDVISREGNSKHFDAKYNISLLAAQTTLEGPIYKGAWLFSARRTYFDQVFKQTGMSIPPYYFYDLQGHVFTDISAKDRLSISFYKGLDDFKYSDIDLEANWGNNTVSLNYRKLFTSKLIANFLLAQSQFHTNFTLGGESGLVSTNKIDDLTFNSNLTYFTANDITVYFGIQAKRLGFDYLSEFNDSANFHIDVIPHEIGLYSKLKWKITEKFIFEPGIRLDYYSAGKSKYYPNPRLGLKWILSPDQFLNIAVGRYYQFIETFQDDYNPSLLDSWFAVDNTVEPASSNHYILGYENYFADSYRFQIDTYYKDIYNMLTFEESRASTDGAVSDSSISDLLTPADGYAAGMELFLQKTRGRLSGWLAYTYSVSIKKMNEENYFTNWDRRHAFNFIGSYKLKDGDKTAPFYKRMFQNAEINWKFTYQSGQAYTQILGYYVENLPDYTFPTYRTIPGGRNSSRYPAYHRLDFSFVKHFNLKHFDMDFYIQLINAYNRRNIFMYYYTVGNTYNGFDDDGDWDEALHDIGDENGFGAGNGIPDHGEPNVDEPDETIIRKNELSIFPIIPSIGFSFEF